MARLGRVQSAVRPLACMAICLRPHIWSMYSSTMPCRNAHRLPLNQGDRDSLDGQQWPLYHAVISAAVYAAKDSSTALCFKKWLQFFYLLQCTYSQLRCLTPTEISLLEIKKQSIGCVDIWHADRVAEGLCMQTPCRGWNCSLFCNPRWHCCTPQLSYLYLWTSLTR